MYRGFKKPLIPPQAHKATFVWEFAKPLGTPYRHTYMHINISVFSYCHLVALKGSWTTITNLIVNY